MDKKSDHRLGHRQRLKERYLKSGLNGLSEYEIVELLLALGTPRKDVKESAKELLKNITRLVEYNHVPDYWQRIRYERPPHEHTHTITSIVRQIRDLNVMSTTAVQTHTQTPLLQVMRSR